MTSAAPTSVPQLLSAGRLQEAEWLMRRGGEAPLSLKQLAQRLGTRLSSEPFFVSPGYYAPLPSWVEAERCCGEAYHAASVVERYQQVARLALSQQNTLSPLSPYTIRQLAALHHTWMALNRPAILRVLDFGGAMGGHFHSLKIHWPWCRLHWTVCETVDVAAAGAAEFECDCAGGSQLRFSDDAAALLASGVDLVFASASLQYVENWPAMVEQFRAAAWLMLDRVPLIEHPTDLIAIQVVPASYTDTRYPGWKFAVDSWLPRLAAAGFQPVMHWLVPEDRWDVLDLETGQYRWAAQHDHGFLLRRASPIPSSQLLIRF